MLAGSCLYSEEASEERTREYLYLQVCVEPGSPLTHSQSSSYGSPVLLPRYWFIIRQSQAPHLHMFFTTWFRQLYLEEDTDSVRSIKQDLFTQADVDFVADQSDWGQEQVEEEEEEEVVEDHILNIEQRKELAKHFPPRCITHSWERGVR